MDSRVAHLLLIVFLSGCASYQIAGQVENGRRALMANDPEGALPYLLEAAKSDPKYVYTYDLFRESVWTYLGRSQYATKKVFQGAPIPRALPGSRQRRTSGAAVLGLPP